MQETTSTLYIPDNIKTKFEIVSGFGWKEIIITAIAVFAAFIFAVVLSNILDADGFFLQGFTIMAIVGGAAFTALKKNENNLALIDHLRLFSKFAKQQQKFKYSYYNQYFN